LVSLDADKLFADNLSETLNSTLLSGETPDLRNKAQANLDLLARCGKLP
jgi:hypothetical protein